MTAVIGCTKNLSRSGWRCERPPTLAAAAITDGASAIPGTFMRMPAITFAISGIPALCIRRRPTRPQRSGLDQRHKEADGRMGCTSNNKGVSLGRGPGLHDPRPGSHLWHHRHTSIACHGHSGQANCTSLTLAEWLCRTVDWIDSARVLGPRYCLGRGTSAPDSKIIRRLLQLRQNASVIGQRCAGFSPGSADRKHQIVPHLRRTSSSLRQSLGFRYTQPP